MEGSDNDLESGKNSALIRCCRFKKSTRDFLIHWSILLLIGFSLWGILYSIAGQEVKPGSHLFSLAVIIILAYIAGEFIRLFRLPPLLGMLLMGLFLRNVHLVDINEFYMELMVTVRQVALCIILTRAGLILDPAAMKLLGFFILRLATVPACMEILVVTFIGHYFMGMPWIWGVLAGSIVSALSPAIVVPSLMDLQERGYGIDKNICTVLIAAASLDNVLAITVFGVVRNLLFNNGGSLALKIITAPLGIIIGVSFGIFWGVILHYIPDAKNDNVVLLRVLMIATGGMLIMFGSIAIGYIGAGPLGCVTAAFVASIKWREQGWTDGLNPVAQAYTTIWTVFQPILFGMIGFEVDFSIMEGMTVFYAVMVVIFSLITRTSLAMLISFGCGFNWKEKLFFSWAWFPKAAVQAALGPAALDLAKLHQEVDYIENATKVLIISVVAILIAAPIGAALLSFSGPKLLKSSTKTENPDDQINVHL